MTRWGELLKEKGKGSPLEKVQKRAHRVKGKAPGVELGGNTFVFQARAGHLIAAMATWWNPYPSDPEAVNTWRRTSQGKGIQAH